MKKYLALVVISFIEIQGQVPVGTIQSGGGNTVLGPQTAPPPLFVQTNSVTVTGTLSVTSIIGTGFGSPTLPANFFAQSGSILRGRWQGIFAAGGSLTNSTLLIKLGSVTIGTITVAMSVGASGNVGCGLDFVMTARTVGSSGTIMMNGAHLYCDSASTGTNAVTFQNANTSAATVNTTTTELFDMTIGLGNTAQSMITTDLVLTGY